MKKIGNIILIIVAVIVLHTIIDLIAIYNFNRPVFAIKGDNYKYHGLFYDTYFCREYSAPFIKAKWNKYECIIPNENIITEDKTKKISKIQRKNGQKCEICYKRGERSAGKELGE